MARRRYSNVSPPVALTAAVSDVATTLPVGSTTGYPDVPFTAAIERGTVNEELVLVGGKDATNFTSVTRGYDGTSAKAHVISSPIEHVVAAIDYDEANAHVNDSAIHAGGNIPIGGIIMWSGAISAIPTGWILCDGLGGSPDLRGRMIVGASVDSGGSNSVASYNKGATGGADNHTLATANLPAHSHAATASTTSHTHAATAGNQSVSHTHSGTTNSDSHAHTGSVASDSHKHATNAWAVGVHANHTHPHEEQTTAFSAPPSDGVGVPPRDTTTVAHSHGLTINSDSHTHGYTTGNQSASHNHTITVSPETGHTHDITVSNTGSGTAVDHRPRFYALALIMRVS